MSTWHQQRNPGGIRALWQSHPTKWKCISDKPNQCASSITFGEGAEGEAECRAYAAKTGDRVIPPGCST